MEMNEIIKEYRKDLTDVGFEELLSSADVDKFMQGQGSTKFVVINSVCGCAAGSARPGVKMALEDEAFLKIDSIATVFAGQDMEATETFREWVHASMPHVPPSSPSFYLFKDDSLVYIYPRHFIEGRSPSEIRDDLVEVLGERLSGVLKQFG